MCDRKFSCGHEASIRKNEAISECIIFWKFMVGVCPRSPSKCVLPTHWMPMLWPRNLFILATPLEKSIEIRYCDRPVYIHTRFIPHWWWSKWDDNFPARQASKVSSPVFQWYRVMDNCIYNLKNLVWCHITYTVLAFKNGCLLNLYILSDSAWPLTS